jgi:hypothetical protein
MFAAHRQLDRISAQLTAKEAAAKAERRQAKIERRAERLPRSYRRRLCRNLSWAASRSAHHRSPWRLLLRRSRGRLRVCGTVAPSGVRGASGRFATPWLRCPFLVRLRTSWHFIVNNVSRGDRGTRGHGPQTARNGAKHRTLHPISDTTRN